ncbi:MAG TPA: DNA translocase FtsK 4TM domain-containing protein, partial [Rhodocyclaceae bacterium]|nr:DNA translocase FtsK 4TM domain-containing protein [Rhodocyclaceae bacterium]
MTIALTQRNPSLPLPEKIAALVHEVRWLVVAAIGIYLALILWGYNGADPGWSHAARAEQIANPGGRFGAWLADLLFYLFGLSAWWCVGLLFFLVAWGYRRLNILFGGDRRPLTIALFGFAVLLLASSGMEAMRFWSLKAALPLVPGGMLGLEIGRLATRFLGFTGGTLALLTLCLAGVTLFLGVSWLGVAERVGALLEDIWFGGIELWQRWQDRRYGRAVAERREATVEGVRRKFEITPPVRIEPVELEIPRAPKAEARIEKERQQPLFFSGVGDALPPLRLLDEPVHDPASVPAAETLEFTSRLIERKLGDFGVEVKVVSAHPGPVVTRYEIEPATGVKGATIVGLA